MLQSVLVGKAREIFSALPLSQSGDYEAVKNAILKAYELVPEAYRQKFRNTKKQYDQTHVEFARVKEQLFDRWLTSREVGKNYEKLRQLVLVEEFKQCVHSDVKTHLDEHKVETINEAATMADDYALTHKLSSRSSFSSFNPQFKSNRSNFSNEKKSGGTEKGKPPISSETKKGESKQDICFYCKKSGHRIADCWTLKRKQESRSKPFPNACYVVQSPSINFGAEKPEILERSNDKSEVMAEFRPFVTEGFVSLVGEEDNLQPIRILRDTAASKTLLLEGVLPLSKQSSVSAGVLIQGVDSVIKAPLHKVHIQSDLVTGPVVVGVRPSLPVEGIAMLLGNDLAGEKVTPDPILSENPCVEEDCDTIVYPACAVTRAMRKTLSEGQEVNEVNEVKVVESGNDLGLQDTFFSSAS